LTELLENKKVAILRHGVVVSYDRRVEWRVTGLISTLWFSTGNTYNMSGVL